MSTWPTTLVKWSPDFNFSSLFNKAWFLSIQPHTIVSRFRKVGVHPFNSTAIKPYDNSSISNKIPEATPVMMPVVTQPNERSSVSQDGFSEHNLEESGPGLSPVSYSEEQIELFQRRYDNDYNIYDDQIYVSWLQQQHPDDLLENLSSSTTIETQVNGEQVEPLNCNTSTEDDSTVDKENVVPSPEQPMDSTGKCSAIIRTAYGQYSRQGKCSAITRTAYGQYSRQGKCSAITRTAYVQSFS